MNNWKIVSQIAFGFAIVFVLFAIFAASITFEFYSLEHESLPAGFIQLSVLDSTLVYLLFAVLSFVVAWITMSSSKEKASQEMPLVMPKPQHET